MAPDNTQAERNAEAERSQAQRMEETAPRIAVKDGFAIEVISGVEVRRQVIAGQPVPRHYQVDEDLLGDTKGNPVLARQRRSYKPEQIEERVSYTTEGGVDSVKTETVERVHGSDADRPEAEGEKELAAEHTPLATRAKAGRRPTTAERSRKADEEQERTRAGEREGTPAERIEKRLKAGDTNKEDGGADKASTRRSRPKADAEASSEPKGD